MPTPMQAVRQLEQNLLRLQKKVSKAEIALENKVGEILIPCPYCNKASLLPQWTFNYHVTSEKWTFDELTPRMKLSYSRIVCPECHKDVYIEDWNAVVEEVCARKAYSIGPLRNFIITYRKLMKSMQTGY